jgi:hypothetical protein
MEIRDMRRFRLKIGSTGIALLAFLLNLHATAGQEPAADSPGDDDREVAVRDATWTDPDRKRAIPVRIYAPKAPEGSNG